MVKPSIPSSVQLGIDVLLSERRGLLKGKRIGLVTNYSVVDAALVPVIDRLQNGNEWELVRLFGPEHGVTNSAKEGEHVQSAIDQHTGLRAYSLYGDYRKPPLELLHNLDLLVVDLPDIGSRYYTNMNTLTYCMETCQEVGLPCVVLDRPNPIGGVIREGNILQSAWSSFVGMHPIPNRHGLTMGELALFIRSRMEHPCDLTVVPMDGWDRQMLWPDTGLEFVPPSPNAATFAMCLLYPGTCLFEGTNVSVGRGTAHPFEYIGAPYINGHQLADWLNEQGFRGVRARPLYFVPTYSLHQGEVCQGVALHVVDAQSVEPVRLGIALLQAIHSFFPDDFRFLGAQSHDRPFFDLLAGTSKLRELILVGRGQEYLDESVKDVASFERSVAPYLLYP